MSFLALAYTKLGNHRNNPRLWLQGRRLERAGGTVGTEFRLVADASNNRLTILIGASGSRRISGSIDRPVIDINNPVLREVFGTIDRLKVSFEPGRIVVTVHPDALAETERRHRLIRKLNDRRPLDIASLFHGAGILDAAIHDGLSYQGITSRLAFAIELDEQYLETSMRNNPVWDESSIALNASVDEIEHGLLPKAEILIAGIPCTGASLSGRAKNKHLEHAEEHPSAGHLFVSFLALVRTVQPAIIVIENVPAYRTGPSMAAIRGSLDVMGYDLNEAILNGHALGSLETRTRFCAVAVTRGIEIPIDLAAGLEPPRPRPRNLGEILVHDDSDLRWSSCEGLKAKEARDRAKVAETGKGSGFPMQILTKDSKSVPVICKDYHKWRSTEPKLRHPVNPDLLRQFAPVEHAAIKGIPYGLVDGNSPTLQHQMLGQSICFPTFEAVGRHLGQILRDTFNLATTPITAVEALLHKHRHSLEARKHAAPTMLDLFDPVVVSG